MIRGKKQRTSPMKSSHVQQRLYRRYSTGGSGWLLLSPSHHHLQNLTLASVSSSSAMLYGPGCFALVRESGLLQTVGFLPAELGIELLPLV